MDRILIIQTAFLGDVILATPLIEALHAQYPKAEIDFLLRKGNQSLLEGHPFLRKVLIFDKKRKWQSIRELVGEIQGRRYDLVVNAQRFFTSGLITVLSKAKHTVGFDKNPLSFGYTRKVPHKIDPDGVFVHEVNRNLSLIQHLTEVQGRVAPCLYPSPESYKMIPQGVEYVCMAPTSVWFTKQWPAEKWVVLINSFPAEVKIYLLGSPADAATCEAIQRACQHPNVENVAGKLSLLDSAALMQSARMNYVNDSAPTHLASAVNAPVTTIFCSTVPGFGFTPLSENSAIWESEESLACRPCGLHGRRSCPEGHFKCALTIKVP